MTKRKSGQLSRKFFPSKLLLFGEHTINKGSKGMAIPFHRFEGHFGKSSILDTDKKFSNQLLEVLANYIIFHKKLSQNIDTERLLTDIEDGLFFDSTIPQGYGLGSSGALAAGILQSYASSSFTHSNIVAVREILADIESYYHGKSSGLDALVSYLDYPVIITGDEIQQVTLPACKEPALKWFLLDTGKARSTADFVNHFLQKSTQQNFSVDIKQSLVPTVTSCIDYFLRGDYQRLYTSFSVLSQLQISLMPEFIPVNVQEYWKEGLNSKQYLLKICGAGGGGFMLGICHSEFNPTEHFRSLKVIEVMAS